MPTLTTEVSVVLALLNHLIAWPCKRAGRPLDIQTHHASEDKEPPFRRVGDAIKHHYVDFKPDPSAKKRDPARAYRMIAWQCNRPFPRMRMDASICPSAYLDEPRKLQLPRLDQTSYSRPKPRGPSATSRKGLLKLARNVPRTRSSACGYGSGTCGRPASCTCTACSGTGSSGRDRRPDR